MSFLDKIKKLHNGKLPKSFKLHMYYNEFHEDEKEQAAKSYFKLIMGFPDDKAKAKKLGLI